MNKELNYLSLPDYFNKFLLINYNQKIDSKKNLLLEFKISNKSHLGSALKAVYLLEILIPKKPFVLKISLKKKKKIYFGQKIRNNIFFSFSLNLSSVEFVDFFRFFFIKPLKLNKLKIEENIIVNKKLKQFEFNKKILFLSKKLDNSFIYLTFCHLN